MFILTIRLGHRARAATMHSPAQAAGFIRATARLWGVSPSSLEWSTARA